MVEDISYVSPEAKAQSTAGMLKRALGVGFICFQFGDPIDTCGIYKAVSDHALAVERIPGNINPLLVAVEITNRITHLRKRYLQNDDIYAMLSQPMDTAEGLGGIRSIMSPNREMVMLRKQALGEFYVNLAFSESGFDDPEASFYAMCTADEFLIRGLRHTQQALYTLNKINGQPAREELFQHLSNCTSGAITAWQRFLDNKFVTNKLYKEIAAGVISEYKNRFDEIKNFLPDPDPV